MIYLNKENYSDINFIEKEQYNLGGKIFMSLLNFSLKLSYFNINISINKDESKKKAKSINSIKQEMLIQQANERRQQAIAHSHYINDMMQ